MCGIAALIDPSGETNIVPDAFRIAQHIKNRGQESSAAVVGGFDGKLHRIEGEYPVDELLLPLIESEVRGTRALVHHRYPTSGGEGKAYTQPHHESMRVDEEVRNLFIGFNGTIANYPELRQAAEDSGNPYELDVDTSAVGRALVDVVQAKTIEDIVAVFRKAEQQLDGAWNVVTVQDDGTLLAYRSHVGIRPLAWSMDQSGHIAIASEGQAISKVWPDAQVRDLEPGTLLIVQQGARERIERVMDAKLSHCFFEWAYFAKGGDLDGINIEQTRKNWGRILAEEDADLPTEDVVVVSVPQSGNIAAASYAEARELPLVEGLRKRPKAQRTFIEPHDRERKVREKFEIVPDQLKGKIVILVDDSIVRSTTLRVIVERIREEGSPKEIHVRSAAPPVNHTCQYGINIAKPSELITRRLDPDLNDFQDGRLTSDASQRIAVEIDADSVRYLPLDAVSEGIGLPQECLCTACVDGKYPTRAGKLRDEEAEEEFRRTPLPIVQTRSGATVTSS